MSRVWRGSLFLEVRGFFFSFSFFWGVVVDGGRGPDCGLVAEGLITGDDNADYADCNRKERIWSF